MAVLVDTSIWTDHFKKTDKRLVGLLESNQVLTHSFIVAEIACGTPPDRKKTIEYMRMLMDCKETLLSETMQFKEDNKLYGAGCGIVDFSLLASVIITPNTYLWTKDKNLKGLSDRFGVAF